MGPPGATKEDVKKEASTGRTNNETQERPPSSRLTEVQVTSISAINAGIKHRGQKGRSS